MLMQDVITVYSGDLRVLENNDFLNDNIIDFQVRELIKKSHHGMVK